jgi:hypothetical protein
MKGIETKDYKANGYWHPSLEGVLSKRSSMDEVSKSSL